MIIRLDLRALPILPSSPTPHFCCGGSNAARRFSEARTSLMVNGMLAEGQRAWKLQLLLSMKRHTTRLHGRPPGTSVKNYSAAPALAGRTRRTSPIRVRFHHWELPVADNVYWDCIFSSLAIPPGFLPGGTTARRWIRRWYHGSMLARGSLPHRCQSGRMRNPPVSTVRSLPRYISCVM